MIRPEDLSGVMAMMPAFTTPDGGSIESRHTVEVDELARSVNRMIDDGANIITTTGSFGECHTLFLDELETLFSATVEAAAGRVPVFLGCTGLHTREVLQKMQMAKDAGGDGVLVGVPYYFDSTVDNAVQFYRDIANAFPDLAVMIYHNPRNHHITIPVEAFTALLEQPNIVAMKDSHRDPLNFMRLMEIAKGRLRVFTNQVQLYPYMLLGSAGCWSISAWMGPWPVIAAYEAAARGDDETAKRICLEMVGILGRGGDPDPAAGKLAIAEAGYCNPGPARPPFRVLSQEAAEKARAQGRKWRAYCETFPSAAYSSTVGAAR